MHPTHKPPTTTGAEPTPADLLRAAVHRLNAVGWRQGSGTHNCADPLTPHRMCAAEAISHGNHPATNQAIRELVGHLIATGYLDDPGPDEDIGDPGAEDLCRVWDFNDDPDRTLPEVLAALKGAADAWDRRHPIGGDR
jgi:hypothetical protein